ncbi:type IVB secretion system protein IcmH/DotU [Jannaschia pohangensis]|uniref:Type VI secretion system protein ImpK n=1 Tax=Jannaschia pohangensis TaxID=390807 RepID=A0A1I3UGJ3_9RHOB|nr:type IVB secretion system protein IcmH/DotU [Jannaschia pohangensis]SFJ82160.1 type VI secretion system protein ImpK [Jannaschia pohangensis]
MAGPDDDKDRTVFGQPLPKPGDAPRAVPRPGAGAPPAGGGDRTVIGGALPPGPGGVRSAGGPPAEDTWLGGALPPAGGGAYPPQGQGNTWAPQQPYPPQAQPYPPPHQPYPSQPQPYGQPAPFGGAQSNNGMFPELAQQQAAPQRVAPRISLEAALKPSGLAQTAVRNAIVRAASDMLILLGRLRTGLVEMQSQPLLEHTAREIDRFERRALESGVAPQDAELAKYALAATADDIVQNLPGTDRGAWLQYGMSARFFEDRSSGVNFFRRLEDAMRAPGQRYEVLELMLICLQLGFEGQYRTGAGGAVELQRGRAALYETLRRVVTRPGDDISVTWEAVPLGKRRRYGGLPVWVVMAIAAGMVVALFLTLSTLLNQQGAAVQSGVIALHQGQPAITIERPAAFVPLATPETTQLQRIRDALAPEIASGELDVGTLNDFIYVRLGDVLRFGSGSDRLDGDFTPLANRILAAVNAEEGEVRVVGHTDSIPPNGRGAFKTNEELSIARAITVRDILAQGIDDPDRLEVEGKGSVDPIGDNTTPEGRALNRRVEILIRKEAIQ